MCIRAWVGESAVYRTMGMIDGRLKETNTADAGQVLEAIEEYAVECSIIKVLGKRDRRLRRRRRRANIRGLWVQPDYPMERHYRDARIKRIFRGNQRDQPIADPGMLTKRALKGHLPLLAAAQKLPGGTA